jgi:hypothetical protein
MALEMVPLYTETNQRDGENYCCVGRGGLPGDGSWPSWLGGVGRGAGGNFHHLHHRIS